MDTRVQEQIDIIKNTIVEILPVEQIYLFGSYAYGIPREDSDLDIYVVMSDTAPYRNIEARQMIGEALWGRKSLSADILVNKKSRFLYRCSAPTLEHEVFERGRIIYG